VGYFADVDARAIVEIREHVAPQDQRRLAGVMRRLRIRRRRECGRRRGALRVRAAGAGGVGFYQADQLLDGGGSETPSLNVARLAA